MAILFSNTRILGWALLVTGGEYERGKPLYEPRIPFIHSVLATELSNYPVML